jgi:RNase P/RNase MRP subunit p29
MSSGRSDLIEIACEVRRETDLAVLIFDGAREVWVPKKLVEIHVGTLAGTAVAVMPEWLAIEKGLV